MTDEKLKERAREWIMDFARSRAVADAQLCGIPVPEILAAFASSIQEEARAESLFCDECETELQRESCNHVRRCDKCHEQQLAEARSQAFKEAGDIASTVRILTNDDCHAVMSRIASALYYKATLSSQTPPASQDGVASFCQCVVTVQALDTPNCGTCGLPREDTGAQPIREPRAGRDLEGTK